MPFGIASFRSRQQVFAFEGALSRQGLRAEVVSTPREVALGCGLSVRFEGQDAPRVLAAVERLRAARPDVPVLLPEGERGAFAAGAFTIEYAQTPHVPVPPELMLLHWSLLVRGGGRTIYVTADSVPDAALHRARLAGRTADAAFWNSQYLSYPETRALLRGCAGVSYIYHMPVDDADVSGIRRKCERNMQRFGAELPNVRVLTHYPSILDI